MSVSAVVNRTVVSVSQHLILSVLAQQKKSVAGTSIAMRYAAFASMSMDREGFTGITQ